METELDDFVQTQYFRPYLFLNLASKEREANMLLLCYPAERMKE